MVELTIFALGILLIDLMVPREWKWINAAGAFVGVLFAAFCVWQIQSTLPPRGAIGFYNSLLVDRFAIYFWYLFLAGAAIAILMSVRYLDVEDEHHGEYYSLLLLSVVGMMCMAAGIDIVLIFIGLELMAISTYVLVGFLRRDRRSNEAALKYMLLGAFSSGIFAYGLSLFYGLSGSTNLRDIARAVSPPQNLHNPVVVIALLTTMTGLLFKIAAVPFHQWAPDAYEGAPTSITGFMSVAVKAAAWAMLLRISGVWVVAAAFGLHSRDCGRRHRYHDRRQLRGAHADEYEAPARLLLDCARRLYAAGVCGHGNFAARQSGIFRRLQGNPDLPARLYVHESGSVRRDHVVAPAQCDWRRDRRHGRTLPARSGRSRADAAVSAFTRRHSARRRIPGQVLHLPEPDRKRTLRTGLARRASTRCSDFITI